MDRKEMRRKEMHVPARLTHLPDEVLDYLYAAVLEDDRPDWDRVVLEDGAPIVRNAQPRWTPGETLRRPPRPEPKEVTRVELPVQGETAKRLTPPRAWPKIKPEWRDGDAS